MGIVKGSLMSIVPETVFTEFSFTSSSLSDIFDVISALFSDRYFSMYFSVKSSLSAYTDADNANADKHTADTNANKQISFFIVSLLKYML